MPPTTTTTKLSKEDQETIRKWWRDYDVPVIGVYTKDKEVHVTDWSDTDFTNYDFEAALQRGDYDNGIAIRLGKTLTGKNGGYLTAIDLDHESAVTAWFGDWDRVIRYAQSGFVEWHKDKTSLHVLVYSDEPFKTVNFKLKGGQIEIRCERQLLFAASHDKTISMIEQINQRIKDILYNSQYREYTDFIMDSLPYVVSTHVTKFDIVQILKNIRKDLPILLTPENTRKLLDHLEEVRKEFNTIGSYSRTESQEYMQQRIDLFLIISTDEQKKIAQSMFEEIFQEFYPYYENKKEEMLEYLEECFDLVERLIRKNRMEWIDFLMDVFIRDSETYLKNMKDEFEKASPPAVTPPPPNGLENGVKMFRPKIGIDPITRIQDLPQPRSFRRGLVFGTGFSLLLISIVSVKNMWEYFIVEYTNIYEISLLIFSAWGISYVVFLWFSFLLIGFKNLPGCAPAI